ncbi:MAG: capsular biosynthesis protein [Desulfobacteraceae bacterium]|nr:capsular biosynthesis protein [Desulfobacteraceae bacterium]
MKIVGDIQGAKILLLQGPMGTFFRKLDDFFTCQGAVVYKICFNAGDKLFSHGKNRFDYRQNCDDWARYVTKFMKTHEIEKVFLFGNCRFYHRQAIKAAKGLGVEIFVFEEGYIRPDYITLERNGVNGDSSLSRDHLFYKNINPGKAVKALPVENSYGKMAFQAAVYYFFSYWRKRHYPHYTHHRDPSVLKEAAYGIRNLLRKMKYKIQEKKYSSLFENKLAKIFYFVPLQTKNDFQLTEYSDYNNIEEFIKEVVFSFAKNAPSHTYLVIKHHPMERGKKKYARFIKQLAKHYGLKKRIYVVYDVHLPTCLKHAIGTITINSTVGLSALFHNSPTITLGQAVYDIHGLSCKGMKLDKFWKEYKQPSRKLFNAFRKHVISKTQLNGGFHGKFPDFID